LLAEERIRRGHGASQQEPARGVRPHQIEMLWLD
jgi:hypothetical protein